MAGHPPIGEHSIGSPFWGTRRPPGCSDSLFGAVRLPVPLSAEIAVARAAGRLSRLAGAGGGTTIPGKLLWRLDPGAIDRLARRLPLGSAVVSATNGKTTTAAMAARWRKAVRELAADAALCVNGDDPQVGDLARERPGSMVFGVDDPSCARPSLQHAADSKYCVRCGTPYDYAAAYV